MTLTIGTGPLARTSGGGHLNFDLKGASPAHRIWFEPYPARVRAVVGDEVVLDTLRAHLLHETGILPVVYAPLEDYRGDLLTPTDTSTHCPFKGDAGYRSITVGGDTRTDALWDYPEPVEASPWLAGFAALDAKQVDAWFVEEERVVGHVRDPYHRVDVLESSRPVEVRIHGEVVARTSRPKLVLETGMAARAYVPPADVEPGAVAPGSGRRSVCSYKGEATYWTVGGVEDAAWSYDLPLPEASGARGHLAFDDSIDGVEVVFV